MTRLLFAASLLVASATAAMAEEPTVLRGRVLLPDGQPAAGAELYWLQFKAISPKVYEGIAFEKLAAADDQGRFEFSIEQEPPREEMARWVIAYLPGFGVDWLKIVRHQSPPDAVLRLVADNPIRGRVIDTEGRQVSGAQVAVKTIAASPSGSLDAFLAGQESLKDGHVGQGGRRLPLLTTVTNREGRFELSGIGIERLARVSITAPGFATDDVEIVNRAGFDARQFNKAAQAGMLPRTFPSMLFGPVLEHVAEPELAIRGAIFRGADRKPVAGTYVSSYGLRYNPILAQTDELGRFELHGLPRRTNARFHVDSPPVGNLLPRSIELDLAVGQTAVESEVELKEGIAIEGRVFDKATMRGVESEIQYTALPDNHYVEQPGYDMSFSRSRTDEEGRFRILVPPGPAVLMAQVSVGGVSAQAKVATVYRQARFSEEDAKQVSIQKSVPYGLRYFVGLMSGHQVHHYLTIVNAARFLSPQPGSGPVTCDLTLETGKTIKLSIEDEQGQPVTGPYVSGMSDSLNFTRRIAEASCDIVGLGADRPRHVVILQPERHLAGSLTGDEPTPATVRLSATATIAGRALDADGEPLAGARVQIGGSTLTFTHDERSATKTDGDGRFHVENVFPGEPFELAFIKDGKFLRAPLTAQQRELGAGETRA